MKFLVRVIEIGHIVAGPSAGLIFADLGYDVIKIEKPGDGDIARRLTHSSSGAFPFYNRGKRSLTVDLGTEGGKEVFMRLSRTADIIIDNLGFGAMKRLGLSYENLSRVNRRLIYLSIKGYGSGPLERRKSLDFPIEIHSGIAYMTGLSGRPMRVGGSMVDMGAAMFGVIQSLQAIIDREKTGNGRFIDIGLFETALFFMGQHISSYQINGKELKPINEEGFAWAIYDFFPTAEGREIFIAVATDTQWKEFCSRLKLGICDEKMYEKNETRFEHRETLKKIISSRTRDMPTETLASMLDAMNIPYSFLNRPWDLLNDKQAHPKLVNEKYAGLNLKVPTIPDRSLATGDPPSLGEGNDEILGSLGFSPEEITGLRKSSCI